MQHVLVQGIVDPAWPVDGLAVCTAYSTQQTPVLASDGAGGVLVAWQDARISGANIDVYLQHVFANGTKDPAWPLQGAPVDNSLTTQFRPEIVADGNGGAFVCFGSYETNNDVYLEHVLGTGAQDPLWPVNGKRVSPVAADQFNPRMVSDGANGVVIVWEDQRNGNNDLYATRILANGALAPGWTLDGNAVCTAPGSQESYVLVGDGSGGAIFAWHDLRSGSLADLYSQHLRADGSSDPTWPVDGLGISVSPTGDAGGPSLVADGAHGSVVVWYERGAAYDMFAKHVRADGTFEPGTPAGGFLLCNATGNQRQNSVRSFLPDGAGGGFVAWRDERSGATTPDVYATHVLANGAPDPSWPVNGRAVSTAADNQNSAILCEDGSGGALVAWTDKRNGVDFDVYAQRVTRTGDLPVVGALDRAPSHTQLSPPAPNPAAARARIAFMLQHSGQVQLEVFDVTGRRVRMLRDADAGPGRLESTWDLRDQTGLPVPAGLYLVRLTSVGEQQSMRLAVTR